MWKSLSSEGRLLRLVYADGLNPKITELKCFLQEYKIDIALIQETKLTPKAATPFIKGYAAVRGDRKGAEYPGGGLIIYIKEDIVFKRNGHSQRHDVELLSISVKSSARKWLNINNIYIPQMESTTCPGSLSTRTPSLLETSMATPRFGTSLNQQTQEERPFSTGSWTMI